jgi:uncharacterized protein (DUF1800 family)
MQDAPEALVASNLMAVDDAAVSPGEASRFLIQASFGPTVEEIARVQQIGYSAWIDDQLAQPVQKHLPVLLAQPPDRAPAAAMNMMNVDKSGGYFPHRRKFVWWQQSVTATDQLRQRVAYAWSQHFVVSDKDDAFTNSIAALCDYYDTLLVNGLGNFRDLLKAVTYSTCMSVYLTYLGNQKADASSTRRPDENYAREIMQLFTIGLHELNPDGTAKADSKGQPIPTYNNDDVREMARVFTGMHWAGHENNWQWGPQKWLEPLQVYSAYHDSGQKSLLGGRKIIPAGQAPEKDIDDALDCLFDHENTPVLVSHFLIQRLTTSNPTTAYLGRVARVFADNGKGVRGDLTAVVRAILLDPEARRAGDDPDSGKLREPYLRLVGLVRAFKGAPKDKMFTVAYLDDLLGQEPGSSPSVFNFYAPDYSPPGAINKAGMVGPEFEITNAVTSVSLPNFLRDCIYHGAIGRWGGDLILDYSQEIQLAHQPEALINHLSLILTGDRMSADTRDIIRRAIDHVSTDAPEDRVRLAAYLTSICAESAVQP